jgi:transposase
LAAKKKALYASEQDPVARAAWQADMAPCAATALVFFDETSTATNLTRRYARARGGARALGYAPRNYGRRTTLLAALTPQGLTAPMLREGAVDTAALVAYLAQVLVPTLQPGQRVILDNLSCHRAAAARQAIEAVGCTLHFLPTYSPDFNPIELAFSKLKTALRTAAARTQAALDAAIRTALDAEATPLRLPLGDDAVDGVLDHLDRVRDEVRAWERVSRATAFDVTATDPARV